MNNHSIRMSDFVDDVHRAIDKAIVRDHETARADKTCATFPHCRLPDGHAGWCQLPAPTSSQERVAEVVTKAIAGIGFVAASGHVMGPDNIAKQVTDALLAAGVIRDEAEVKAEATERAVDMVEEAADEVDHTLIPTGFHGPGEWFRSELHKLAAAIRAEDYS